MISTQANALTNLYNDWTEKMATGTMDIPEMRDMFEEWGDLATEPADFTYSDVTIGGVRCLKAVEADRADDERTLLCFHGGGFVCGSVESHRKMFSHIAKAVGCKALIVDYTRTPDNPHPGIVRQCADVYSGLLEQGVKAENIAMIGDSAGGLLATAVPLHVHRNGLPIPAASVALSPWYDMEPTGETFVSNADVDAFVSPEAVRLMAGMYVGEADSRDPTVSILYADPSPLPPMLIQVGGHETLLDDSRRFHEKAKAAGVDVELQVFPEMQHVFQLMAGKAPEADDAIAKIAQWLRPKLGL
ncbi:alpha/beta hydrolase [Parasphingorhabdus sp.]|uniref:alpha/beta hydrolase n=1 Tax=Parasphingorhabdus sp. TaxID=2709688 RepID=UPI0030031AD6|tara:strand:- start:23288 stop:24193 length:906 start_codon:yes stop_codon:yes gene_type:complete